MIDLDAIEARAKAATPGPCYASEYRDVWGVYSYAFPEDERFDLAEDPSRETAEFWAACHTDVPALCARVRELEAELKELRWRIELEKK